MATDHQPTVLSRFKRAAKAMLAFFLSGFVPSLIFGVFILMSLTWPSPSQDSVESTVTVTILNGTEVPPLPLQLKLTDLNSGKNLLISKTVNELKDLYFELTMVYQLANGNEPNIDTYHNVRIVEALDVNGTSQPRIGSGTDAVILTMDTLDFQRFIKQRASMKNLYLTEQMPASARFSPPALPLTLTPFPTPKSQATFDLPLSPTLKLNQNQFKSGDPIFVIVSKTELDTDGNTQLQSALHHATIINFLSADFKVLSGPPYANASMIRISIPPGLQNSNMLAFVNDLSGAVAIYLIPGE